MQVQHAGEPINNVPSGRIAARLKNDQELVCLPLSQVCFGKVKPLGQRHAFADQQIKELLSLGQVIERNHHVFLEALHRHIQAVNGLEHASKRHVHKPAEGEEEEGRCLQQA
jgi:hypothetical protein